MAEILEEQSQDSLSAGDEKKAPLTLKDTRLDLYNKILSLKDPNFSDPIKKLGFKEFDNLMSKSEDFQTAILTDLTKREIPGINQETFYNNYVEGKSANVIEDFARPEPVAPPTKEDESFTGQVSNIWKNVKSYATDLSKSFQRGKEMGLATKEAGLLKAGINEAVSGSENVDFKSIANHLKEIEKIGSTATEEDFKTNTGVVDNITDWIKIIPTATLESLSNIYYGGKEKIAASASLGAGIGSVIPGAGTLAGAGTGAKYASALQGYEMEFFATVVDELTEKGKLDTKKSPVEIEKQLKSAFADKELMEPIFKKGHTRAAIIMGVDLAASGGVGAIGKTLGNLAKVRVPAEAKKTAIGKLLSTTADKIVTGQTARLANQTVKTIVKSAPVQTALKVAEKTTKAADVLSKTKLGKISEKIGTGDIVSGGTGEALAQLTTEGKINPQEVLLEGFAESKYIAGMRALGNMGIKKISGKPAAETTTVEPTSKNEDTAELVSDDEFERFKKGDIDPERARALLDDTEIALKDPAYIEKLKTEGWDPKYIEMLEYVHDKAIIAQEKESVKKIAIKDIAERFNISEEEVLDKVNPKSENHDSKILDAFTNTFNNLENQYKKTTEADDSQDQTGVSGEVGGGQESQQAQPVEGGGTQEAGDGGILQAQKQEALDRIDNLLSQHQQAKNENGTGTLDEQTLNELSLQKDQLEQDLGLIAPAAAVEGAAPAEGETAAAPVEGAAAPVTEGAPAEEVITESEGSTTDFIPGKKVLYNGETYEIIDEGAGKISLSNNDRIVEVPKGATLASMGASIKRAKQYNVKPVNKNKVSINGEMHNIIRDAAGAITGLKNATRKITITAGDVLSAVEQQQQQGNAAKPIIVGTNQPSDVSNQQTGAAAATAAPSQPITEPMAGKPTTQAGAAESTSKPAAEGTEEAMGETLPEGGGVAPIENLPSFSTYDGIFKKPSKVSEAKNNFIGQNTKEVYDAMNKISTNFTKIIKELEQSGRLTKKC
jgi:hypothetical protein